VFLEQDILWRAEFARPEDEYRAFRNLWLRVAKNVGQGGRPVVLCGSAVPDQYEACPERRYFAGIHYLALVCGDDLLVKRLKSRPGWRHSGDAGFVHEMVTFNRWFRENARHTKPPMALLDNSALSVQESAERVAEWVRSHR
jgi:hypothetical protein